MNWFSERMIIKLKKRTRLFFNWFYNLKTFSKINILVLIMVAFMLGLSYLGYYYHLQAKVAMNDIYKNSLISVKLINEANANVKMLRSVNTQFFLTSLDDSKKQQLATGIIVLNGLINESLNSFTPLGTDRFEIAKLKQVRDALENYNSEWQKAVALLDSGDTLEAYTYFTDNVIRILDEIDVYLPEIVDFNAQKAKSTIARENLNFAYAEKFLFALPVIAAIFAVALGVLVARSISKPLQVMLANVQELAAGNLLVKKIRNDSREEVGQLTQAFNRMTVNLLALVRRASESSTAVADSTRQLLTITEQGSNTSVQIAAAMTEVAGGTEAQADSVNETVSAIEQITANIQMAAEASQKVTTLTSQTALITENGQRALVQVVEQMDNIRRGTQGVKGSITLMAEGSEQIADIAGLIKGITQQTDLLAFNAEIEAARAGEQGRGFSVVADEIRKLAEKARVATEQISGLVTMNRANIKEVNSAIKAEEIFVENGIMVVNTASQGLSDISAMVNEVSKQVSEISASIQQMAGGSQQIVSEIQHIGNVSQATADRAAKVSAFINEFTNSIEQINLSCQNLITLAKNLQYEIRIFKT
ncbi:MAG TPA: methyl-accepting chemotaxis protein [Desulfitobacteriaceae bacterium]|nr:methyl-accepting chemotaxis protein [Desulfitobacteriaceae bacterium]